MAIWQYDLHCLPEDAVLRRFGTRPLTISRSDFDALNWWGDTSCRADMCRDFGRLLSKSTSWSEDLKRWGEEDGNRIDVLMGFGKVESIFVRIDVRVIAYGFLMGLIDIASKNGWLFLTQDGFLLPASMTRLLSAIQKSDSFRFVSDPEAFLRMLQNHPMDD